MRLVAAASLLRNVCVGCRHKMSVAALDVHRPCIFALVVGLLLIHCTVKVCTRSLSAGLPNFEKKQDQRGMRQPLDTISIPGKKEQD